MSYVAVVERITFSGLGYTFGIAEHVFVCDFSELNAELSVALVWTPKVVLPPEPALGNKGRTV